MFHIHRTKLFICVSILGLGIFSAESVSGAMHSTATVTLEEMLEAALQNNPEIGAAKKRWESFRAKVTVEKSLEKPEIAYQSMYSGDEKLVGVSQTFPFPGKLRVKGQAAFHEALLAEESYHAKEREIRSEVKAAYADYFLAVKSIEIFEENVELMRQFAKVTESKYAVGKVRQTDVLRAQIELSKMLNMLVTLNQEKETAQAMLNSLLNLPPATLLGSPQEPRIKPLLLSYEKLQTVALDNRPELLEATHHKHHSSLLLKSAQLEYLPDITMEFRTRQAKNPELDDTRDIMVGFTIPLWFWKQKSMVDMAKAEKEMSEAEYEATRNRTLLGVKNMLVKAQTADRLVDLYKTSVLPQAEQALKISETAYQSDQTSFLELLDVQRNLLQFRIEHYEHLAEYERWSAELERFLGKDLAEVQQ